MVGACLWFKTSLPSRSLSTCSCVSAWPLTASVRTTGYKKHTLIHNIVFCTFTQHHTHLCEFIGHVFCRMITHYCVSIRCHCDFHITETETCIKQHNDSVSDMGEVWHNNCKCITVTEHLSVHLSRHYACIGNTDLLSLTGEPLTVDLLWDDRKVPAEIKKRFVIISGLKVKT